jgi:type II secretory pathway component GspD/PulD (secretin)
VRVQITVASIDLDDRLDLGVDYLIPTLSDPKGPRDLIATVSQNPSGGGVQTQPSDHAFVAAFTHAPLLVTIVDPVTGASIPISIPRESASLTMDGATVKTNMLLQPTLLITSGDEHEIFAGDNVPIPVASGGATGTTPSTTTPQTGTTTPATTVTDPLVVRQNIERQDVGTNLRVTPTVGEQGGVTLELRVEVSSLSDSLAGPVEEVGPTIAQITVESMIRLRGGEVAVIATAGRPSIDQIKTGIPWLMDLPILGWAFRTTSDRTVNRHLLIAARAEILRPESRDLADRLARELESESGPADHADR